MSAQGLRQLLRRVSGALGVPPDVTEAVIAADKQVGQEQGLPGRISPVRIEKTWEALNGTPSRVKSGEKQS